MAGRLPGLNPRRRSARIGAGGAFVLAAALLPFLIALVLVVFPRAFSAPGQATLVGYVFVGAAVVAAVGGLVLVRRSWLWLIPPVLAVSLVVLAWMKSSGTAGVTG
ncbi:hypothetical protein [Tahibacter amnicola]|uniref:Uncharacterized protein n=1 Tax=Tahibacter amnicola TaxID=2976241 RepID=A0ABY6BKV9_9GAMM|nr:hypothetical protein [Tahibacter amnicola]UXI70500.1 hypothetical protein N4264_12940 [Tahibacter amnicola]